jgi:phosphomannomutase
MKVEGRTLIDALMDLYKTHGLYYADQKVLSFPPGREGMEQMTEIMDNLRKNLPQEILGQKVTLTEDYLPGLKGLPPSNVLLYRLEDDSRIIARPSGTEPKIKIYGSVKAPLTKDYDTAIATCTTKLDQLLTAFTDHLNLQ